MLKTIFLFFLLTICLTACRKTTLQTNENTVLPDTPTAGPEKTVEKLPEIVSTPVYTIPKDVKLVDSQAFSYVDTDVITEIVVHEAVGAMDFVYLNTFPSLEKITIDQNNPHYRNVTDETCQSPSPEGCVIMSMASTEIFYIPAPETNRIFVERTAFAEQYPENTEIRLYTCGITIDVYYTNASEENTNLWYMTDICIIPADKTYKQKTKACPENTQISGQYGLSVFPVSEGLVVSQMVFVPSAYEPMTYLFTNDIVLPCLHPEYRSGTGEIRDVVVYYPGEDGALLYTRTNPNMVETMLWDWRNVTSTEQYWKEDGIVVRDADTLRLTPTKFYTITDYFAEKGTTPEVAYRMAQEAEPDRYLLTWEELLLSNERGRYDMCSVHHTDYHAYSGEVIKYIDEIHGEGTFSAWVENLPDLPWDYVRNKCPFDRNIVDCLQQFEVPKEVFEEMYYTGMYYIYRYDPDILYSDDERLIEDYFTIDNRYYVDLEKEIRTCIWKLKIKLYRRLETIDIPAEIKEKYASFTNWTFPHYIMDIGITKAEFTAILDDMTPEVPKRPNKNTYGSMYVEPAIYINTLFNVDEIFGFTKYAIGEDEPEYQTMKEIEEAETVYDRALLVLALEKTFLQDMDEIRFGTSAKENMNPDLFS